MGARTTTLLNEELLHFSRKPIPAVLWSTVSDLCLDPKPVGLWVSVGTSWAEWCLAEQFATDSLNVVHRVVLASRAAILRLSSATALDAFTERYGTWRTYTALRTCCEINWPRIAERYDGIIIAPYQWERRHSLSWYYGWDVASGCIWHPRAVASIEACQIASGDLLASGARPRATGERDASSRHTP